MQRDQKDEGVQPKWMTWEELPWFERADLGGSVLQLCSRLVQSSLESTSFRSFIQAELTEIANEFSLQWVAVIDRLPHWSSIAEFGRKAFAELPIRFFEEVIDRDAAGLSRAPTAAGTLQGILAVPLHGSALPGSVLVMAGRTLGPESLPGGLAVARTLGIARRITEQRSRDVDRAERLRATLRISSQFAAAKESRSLLELIAEEATRLLRTDRSSIFIWDRDQHEVVACPALGVEGGSLRLPDNVGIVGETIQTGRTVIVDDAYQDARFNKDPDTKSGYRTRNLLCVPLIDAEGKRIGAFEVINKLEGDFNADDAETLGELGIQAAIALRNTQEREELMQRHRHLTEQVTQGVRIIGSSPPIVALRDTIGRLAATELPVLILGESGTGKEVVAQSLHYQGSRRDHPFVAINCAALTETLLESELFGHEKGAFTDAHEARQGKFELAAGGTLFLDEIGDMSLGGQAKLLRVLEQRVVTRVGGSQNVQTNVRVVAATNANLAESVRQKKFREDLFYRLSVVTLDLPALRLRSDDILLLAEHFLEQFCRQASRKMLTFSPEARQRMLMHNWPGNVRELRNLMERVAFLCAGERIEEEDLAFIISPERDNSMESLDNAGLTKATCHFQQEFIRKAIHRAQGNMSKAAELLGLHRSNLYRKMRQLDMAEAADGED